MRFFKMAFVILLVSILVLENVKTPKDYGMDFVDSDIITPDGIRLSAWEIPAPSASDKTIIMNHALSTSTAPWRDLMVFLLSICPW